MGKRGPKPKPSLIRQLEGDAGRLGVNPKEPQCDYWPVKPPIVGADQIASAEWDRLSMVVPPRLFCAMDEGVLSQYAAAWAQFVRAQTEVSERGILIATPITDRDGNIVGEKLEANPALPALARANETLFKCGDRLGLSPSSRARVNMPSREEFKSRFSGLLGKAINPKAV